VKIMVKFILSYCHMNALTLIKSLLCDGFQAILLNLDNSFN